MQCGFIRIFRSHPAMLRDVKLNKPSPVRMKDYSFTNAVGKVARIENP